MIQHKKIKSFHNFLFNAFDITKRIHCTIYFLSDTKNENRCTISIFGIGHRRVAKQGLRPWWMICPCAFRVVDPILPQATVADPKMQSVKDRLHFGVGLMMTFYGRSSTDDIFGPH